MPSTSTPPPPAPLPQRAPPARSKIVWMRTVNLILLVTMFIVNGIAAAGVINGQATGEVSRKYFTYVTPAGWAFSIWGLIYFTLACWGVYQVVPRTFEERALNQGVGWVFAVSALFNVGWIVAWQYEVLWLSVVLIVGLLACLAVIYARLSRFFTPAASWVEWFFVHLPFSLYLAWVIAASLVNIFVLATAYGNPNDITPSIIGIVLIGLIEMTISVLRLDPVIAAVGTWALAAIAANYRVSVPSIFNTAFIMAIITGVTFLLVLVFNAVAIVRGRRIPWTQKTPSPLSG